VLLTGEPISAVDAKQYGLVGELTEAGAALAGAQHLAKRIAVNAPLALARVKELLRETQGLKDADAFARQDQAAHSLIDSEDAHEGALAFAEKRAPVWRGR
jgi:enoyl-CoA hydratase